MGAYIYDLTGLTGREANTDRTWFIASFEAPRRVVIIILVSLIPTIFMSAILWPLLGQYVIFLVPVLPILGVALFHFRSSEGLKLRPYQQFIDRRKAKLNTVLVCGVPVDASGTRVVRLVSASAPCDLPPAADRPVHEQDSVFSEVTA